jgi:hypothetical protein
LTSARNLFIGGNRAAGVSQPSRKYQRAAPPREAANEQCRKSKAGLALGRDDDPALRESNALPAKTKPRGEMCDSEALRAYMKSRATTTSGG